MMKKGEKRRPNLVMHYLQQDRTEREMYIVFKNKERKKGSLYLVMMGF